MGRNYFGASRVEKHFGSLPPPKFGPFANVPQPTSLQSHRVAAFGSLILASNATGQASSSSLNFSVNFGGQNLMQNVSVFQQVTFNGPFGFVLSNDAYPFLLVWADVIEALPSGAGQFIEWIAQGSDSGEGTVDDFGGTGGSGGGGGGGLDTNVDKFGGNGGSDGLFGADGGLGSGGGSGYRDFPTIPLTSFLPVGGQGGSGYFGGGAPGGGGGEAGFGCGGGGGGAASDSQTSTYGYGGAGAGGAILVVCNRLIGRHRFNAFGGSSFDTSGIANTGGGGGGGSVCVITSAYDGLSVPSVLGGFSNGASGVGTDGDPGQAVIYEAKQNGELVLRSFANSWNNL